MRRNVLAVCLVASGLAGFTSDPALAVTRPAVAQAAEQPGGPWPSNGGAWLWDGMMERFTVPLEPYWFEPWVRDAEGAPRAGLFAGGLGRGK